MPKTGGNIDSPLVAILLCTYNGSRFLAQQLDSITGQDHKNFKLWVSDDGSEDNTLQILEQYQALQEQGRVLIVPGPQLGPARNFLSLICRSEIQADYYSYADQDDIWQSDKLSRAIAKLAGVPNGVPALYCSRTCLIDESGREIGLSPLLNKKPLCFANALVQNIAGGNTMVMNNAARDLMLVAGEKAVVVHDWWTYMLVSGAEGTVVYDQYPTVRYRQHGKNLMGSNIGWDNRFFRFRELLKGTFRGWNTINTQALQEIRHLLIPENQKILDEFSAARHRWLIPRIRGMRRSGIYRQTRLGNLGLILAIILKKI